MVFLIEKIKGSWFWRLRSTLFKKVVATSHGSDTRKECLAEIAVIKEGAAAAAIQQAEGGLVVGPEEPPTTSEESVP